MEYEVIIEIVEFDFVQFEFELRDWHEILLRSLFGICCEDWWI